MIRMLLLAAPLALASTVALAAEDDNAGKPYTETRFGQVTPDFDNLDPAWAIGQTAGYPIPGLSWLAVELDVQVTLFGGDNSGGQGLFGGGGGGSGGGASGDGNCPDTTSTTDPDCPLFSGGGGGGGGGNGNSGNVSQTSDPFRMFGYGLYASATTPGKLFAQAKYGVSGMNTSIREIQDLAGGTSWKAGVGYRATRDSLVSLEYTHFNKLVNGLHLGLRYDFGNDD